MEIINKRRSIRKYLSKKVESEKIELLLRAAMQAPSARNQQPWEFIVVENQETKERIAEMGKNAWMLPDAPLAIVLVGNEDKMSVPDKWEQDMGAATQNILLEAVELGLGAVWIGVYPDENRVDCVREVFNLKEKINPFGVIAIGYPAEGEENKFVDRFDKSNIHYEKY